MLVTAIIVRLQRNRALSRLSDMQQALETTEN